MNGIIIIDKPTDWTSQDVCSKLRGLFHEKRVGHGGTLDPMATGVLPVFLGRATRAAQFSENSEKRYAAGLRPGLVTDTQDITGRIISKSPRSVTAADIEALLPRFTGEIEQLPPMYSAIKIGGKKLYELARRGEEVERQTRRVTIKSLALIGEENGDFFLDVTCSKGTYIRALINDIGAALGCGAAMSSLRRTMAGGFKIDEAVPLKAVIDASPEEREGFVRPVDSIFGGYPAVTIGGKALRLAKNGSEFRFDVPDGPVRVYAESGEFLLLGSGESGVIKTVKSFFEV